MAAMRHPALRAIVQLPHDVDRALHRLLGDGRLLRGRSRLVDELDAALQRGETWRGEFSNVRADGEPFVG